LGNILRWCLPTLSIAFLVQEVYTTATLLDRESSETSSKLVLEARGTNVLKDKYFIPAIATISAFVLLSLVCLYFLGYCCNSKKMDEFHSKSAAPARPVIRNSASYQRPIVNLNGAEGSDRYSNVSHSRTPPHTTPPALPSPRLQQPDANLGTNGNQWSSMAPPTSHGFQSIAHTSIPPSVMSVRHLNPTAGSYQYDRSQVPRPHVHPDARRMPSVSSVTSSTQIGSVVEQAPYVYSPHVGNTLSYVSSTAPSVAGQPWDASTMPRMSTNEEYFPTADPGYPEQMPTSGPPAYLDNDKSRPVDIRKS